MSAHTPGPWRDAMDRTEFMSHLNTLRDAVDQTQPLAELAGNFSALSALMILQDSAVQILSDIEMLLDEHSDNELRDAKGESK